MYRKILPAALGLLGSLSFAAAPVASVSISESFRLDGRSVSAKGVASWPLVVGDELATGAAPAQISFRDGSSIALAAGSSAKISGTSAAPVFVLVSGSLDYNLVKNSKVSVTRAELPAKSKKGHVAVIAAAASAAAIAPAVAMASANSAATGTLAGPSSAAAASTASTAAAASTTGDPELASPSLLRLPPVSQHQ
ncbi:MAG TPA: hypothetical protein VH369_05185 [Bryobacteraceae bacterium]|jgi:hypothetical protein